MPKERTLKAALDRHKGRDYKQEKQAKAQKEAGKRKRQKLEAAEADGILEEAGGVAILAALKEVQQQRQGGKVDEDATSESGWEDDEQEDGQPDISRLVDSDSDSESDDEDFGNGITSGGAALNVTPALVNAAADDEAEDDEDDEDDEEGSIALSDISEADDTEDLVPHQRLTINNTSALTKALKSFSLPYSELSFSEHQSITTTEPVAIADVNDDLNRELAFYAQSLAAATSARKMLKAEGVPFTRPTDYFAEMVKTDEHMGKIKAKLMDDAASKKASAEARRQRDLKKFGKQVQQEKLQERAKEKREMLDKVKILKRKRAQSGAEGDKEDDLFDVALEDAAETEKKDKDARRRGQDGKPNFKRQKKDEKFGFGGKKRGAKRGDALSTGDMSGYSTKRMKGQDSGRGGKKRLGKSRRAKAT